MSPSTPSSGERTFYLGSCAPSGLTRHELHRLCRPGGAVVFSTFHPAMLLRGVQAGFVDPATGMRVNPQSYRHQISDYVNAALRSGLLLDHMSEHAVDEAQAARSPRSRKYLNWPLLLLMRLSRDPHARYDRRSGF